MKKKTSEQKIREVLITLAPIGTYLPCQRMVLPGLCDTPSGKLFINSDGEIRRPCREHLRYYELAVTKFHPEWKEYKGELL